jgi:hypothetical protein
MDTLQERLSLMGFEAEVSNHNGWLTIANKIADDRKRGHTGATAVSTRRRSCTTSWSPRS